MEKNKRPFLQLMMLEELDSHMQKKKKKIGLLEENPDISTKWMDFEGKMFSEIRQRKQTRYEETEEVELVETEKRMMYTG